MLFVVDKHEKRMMKKFEVKITRIETFIETVCVDAEDEKKVVKVAECLDVEEGQIDWREITNVEYKYDTRELCDNHKSPLNI